ncbi:MAG: histidine triad nucleotide-binding protein [Actinomycetota bacterium]|jgi:histidine triad (HIT) family protein|nr:histidine triad nucleotide-binding protein [Actinomycetota bacterium]
MSACLFCDVVAGKVPAEVVRSTEKVVAFRDINPTAPVHVLVVPRRHIENAAALELEDAEEVAEMLVTAREVANDEGIASSDRGYRLVMNVGSDAMNSVPHLHLHVIGGRAMTWPPG